MENINLIPEDQLGVGSGIKLAVCDTEHDLYWRMAIEVAELIKKNVLSPIMKLAMPW